MKPLPSIAGAFLALAASGAPVVAAAQSIPSPYTSATRYDAMGRVTGTIAPDPDGAAGPLKHAATRTTYDAAGRPVEVESGELSSWKSEAVEPRHWGTAFEVLSSVETTYDVMGRKIVERVKGSDDGIVAVTQYSYDNVGRLECTAVRMNPAAWGSLPASACTLDTQGAFGPDRITKNIYDAAGQILQVRKAVGTSAEIADVTYSYALNGKIQYVVDANGNRAELRYDGHDRQNRWVFPSKTRYAFDPSNATTARNSAGPLNEGDYEAYTYDANGNRLTLRKRDGSTISYQYDALNRVTRKTIPNRADLASVHVRDVFYSYDLRSLQTSARFDSPSGVGLTATYDGFGRTLSSRSNLDGLDKTLTYAWDANGNRARITHFDSQYFQTDYDGLDRPAAIRQNTAVLGSTTYNQRGLPALHSWTYAAASANKSSWGYDPAGRLNSLGIDLHGTGSDVSWSYTRNPASQIRTETQSNDSYSWDGHVNLTRGYTTNGLNQYTAAGMGVFCYDANGNLTADGTSVYKYDVENRLVERRTQTNTTCTALSYTGALQAELRYDPLGRLYAITSPSGTTRYLYDGDARVAEFSGTHALLRRYVHGPDAGADDPLIWYEGSTVAAAARRYLHADARGSIVAVTNYQGTSVATNTYDEYGIPSASNQGAFQYTGQTWLDELGMYYYKARIYSPTLGRFLQTDPIGYEDQVNLYAYVGNDPINGVDPTGRCTGSRITNDDGTCASTGGFTTDLQGAAQGMQFRQGIREGLTQQLSMAAEGRCSGSNCATDFAELSDADRELAGEILDSKKVMAAMVRSWERTLRSGKERGFWIYEDRRRGFFPGEEKVGTKTSIQLGNPLNAFQQRRAHDGWNGLPQARFHTHPGNYPDAARPSRADLSRPAYLMFIYTYKGIIYGRN